MVSLYAAIAVLPRLAQGQSRLGGKDRAASAYRALEKRLSRIKTLSMYVVNGRIGPVQGSRWVLFPPRRNAGDDPKTVEDCFDLWLGRWDWISRAMYHGKKVLVLKHIPTDGGDGFGVLYISERTGWPVALGYSVDRGTPEMTEFAHLRVRLKRRR